MTASRRQEGGAEGSGAPRGERNGSYRYGLYTEEAIAQRKAMRASFGHCQSKFYTDCSRIIAGWSSTVFAHESATRSAGFDAENRLY
jgi:hypothetical protein